MERRESGRAGDPLIGRVLDGRYRVGEKVAKGGMATVYQAEDLRLERTVAIKVMHADLADDAEFVSRFIREARSAARLSHHNVVSVFDQGDDDGTLFLVMEYVPGKTLRDVIRADAPLPPSRALALIEPVLAALAAAHGAGMIHRDVKPENVLIADDGRIKVADFGLARAVSAETQHTSTGGVLIGTVSYLSPELVVDGKADARSDVYAAGVLIYEMLTGLKPHQAETPIQVAYKHVHEDVPAPSELEPDLPAYVDALVARATARDRDLRSSDGRVLLHQVRRVRQALDHGVDDDPDLVEDLLPHDRRRPDSDPTGVIPLEHGAVHLADEVYNHELDEDFTAPLRPAPTGAAPVPPPPRRPPPPQVHPDGRGFDGQGFDGQGFNGQGPDGRGPARPDPALIAREPGADHRPRKRSRRGLYLLIGVLVAAIIAGVAAWQVGHYTTTPSVINLSAADAKAKLRKSGLKYRLGTAEYSKATRDTVIRTSPAPGDRVAKGDTVTVILSLGPEMHAVPSTAGKTIEEATALIEDADLKVGVVSEKYNETVPAGQVVRTVPAAGQQQEVGSLIDVVISKGRQPVKIPDWTGKAGAAAKTALARLGFKVTVTQDFSDTVPAGRVITQTPSSGTGFKNDVVALTISKGVQMIEVPEVRRDGLDEATAKLRALGFNVAVERSALYLGYDVVAGSDPDAGTLARHGSTVTLTVI